MTTVTGIDPTVQNSLEADIGRGDPSLAGQFVMLLEVDRRNVLTDATDTFRAATDEFATDTTDTPANKPYHARFRVPDISQSIWGGDNGWQYNSGESIAQLEILNPDGVLDDEFSTSVYNWKGRTATILTGLQRWSRSQFRTIPGGNLLILDVLPGEDVVTLNVAPLIERLDRPIQSNYYAGYGDAYDFDSAANVNIGDVYNLGLRDCTLSIRFKIDSVGAAARSLYQKRSGTSASAGNAGYSAFFDSSEQLHYYLDDGTNIVTPTIGSAGDYVDGEWHELDTVINRTSGTMFSYIDGVEIESTDISSLTAEITNTVNLRHGSTSAGTQNFSGEIDEPRVWYKPLCPEHVASVWKFAADGSEDGLVGAWTYDEDNVDTGITNVVRGPMIVQQSFNGSINCSMGNTADPGSSHFSLSSWFRINPGSSGVIASRKNSGTDTDPGYALRISSGDIIAECSDGTTEYSATIAGDYDDGTAYGACMVIARGSTDTLTLYVIDYPRGTITASSPTDISGAGSFGGGTINFKLGDYDNGSDTITARLSWVLYAPIAFDEDGVRIALSEQIVPVIENLASQPPYGRTIENTSNAHWWPLLEQSGTSTTDEIGASNGTYSSAPTRVNRDGALTTGGSSAFVTTLTGDPPLKGTPIPVSLGFPQRVRLILIDSERGIYQYSDPSLGACKSVHLVQAGGVDLTLTTDYTVDLTNCTLTLVTSQDHILTADIEGVIDSGGTWLKYPGEIASFVWENMLGVATGNIDANSISAFDDLHPYVCGIHISPDERISFEAFHELLLSPDGYARRTIENKMALDTRIDPQDEDSIIILNETDIKINGVQRIPVPPPSWLIRIGYDRTWWVTDATGVGSGSAEDKQQELIEEWRYVESSRSQILTDYADALPRVYGTPIRRLWNASLIAERMLDLDGVARQGWAIQLAGHHWAYDIGSVIEVEGYSRYDISGNKFVVLGYSLGMTDGSPTTELLVWG